MSPSNQWNNSESELRKATIPTISYGHCSLVISSIAAERRKSGFPKALSIIVTIGYLRSGYRFI